MKILYIQDMDPMTNQGGAQLTDRSMIIEGIRRGHDIQILTPQNQQSSLEHDIFIISNVSMFAIELFQELAEKGKKTIWFNHDYWPICKWRLFYPMRETCKQCYLKERWLPVFQAAKMMIWLSPLHRDSWLWLYPELESMPYHLAPSPVDPAKFFNLRQPRNGALNIEGLHPFKGMKHNIKWAEDHPDIPVTFVGGSDGPVNLPPNCSVIDWVPNEKLNDYYNQFVYFLHLPQSPSPFDRTTAEAYLAGCKIIGNKNIGALSYPWFKDRDSVAENLKKSPSSFWEAIEGAI